MNSKPKVVFLSIAWMKKYQGSSENDRPINGGSYVDLYKEAHECCNYLPQKDNMLRGHVETWKATKDRQIHIENISEDIGKKNEETGVLVIWLATAPSGGKSVIGWWKNATLYRKRQSYKGNENKHQQLTKTHINNHISSFRVECKVEDAVLLTVKQRNTEIFRFFELDDIYKTIRKGWPGQTQWTFYESLCTNAKRKANKIIKFIESNKNENVIAPPSNKVIVVPRSSDPEARWKVEQAAINAAELFYKKIYGSNSSWVDRSKEDRGYDYDLVLDDGSTFNIEVKGRSVSLPLIELTPNEYSYMNNNMKLGAYRLCIVTSALGVGKSDIYDLVSFGVTKEIIIGKQYSLSGSKKLSMKHKNVILSIRERIGAKISK
jgi:hypothetical protein